jgi:hypothetical protein
MGTGDLSAFAPAAELTTFDKRAVREWSDEEMSAVFDRIFNRMPRKGGEDRSEVAQRQMNMLFGLLGARQRIAVSSVCARAEWPAWLEHRVGRRTLRATDDPAKLQAQARTVASWEREREILISALDRIASALFIKVKTDGKHASTGQRSLGEMNAAAAEAAGQSSDEIGQLPSRGRIVEEQTDHVTPEGELLWTVIRKRRLTR